MEEVEAGLLEGGIGWLAETILENLDADKLDEWIRQVGLADDTKKLRSEIERADGVVADVKGRAIGNRSLARSLGRLREVLYDADDAVDELDYYRLQQQVQGGKRVCKMNPFLCLRRSTESPFLSVQMNGKALQRAQMNREQSKQIGRIATMELRAVAVAKNDPRHGRTLKRKMESLGRQDVFTVTRWSSAVLTKGHLFCIITSRVAVVTRSVKQATSSQTRHQGTMYDSVFCFFGHEYAFLNDCVQEFSPQQL